MAVEVAGIWELGWNTPIKEADLWEFPLREFGVDRWFMAPVTGILHTFLREVHDLRELVEARDPQSVVFLDERGSTPLRYFEHPADVLYVCGKASLSAMVAYGLPGSHSIRVETVLHSGMLWPHQALPIVLYDRMVKQWR